MFQMTAAEAANLRSRSSTTWACPFPSSAPPGSRGASPRPTPPRSSCATPTATCRTRRARAAS